MSDASSGGGYGLPPARKKPRPSRPAAPASKGARDNGPPRAAPRPAPRPAPVSKGARDNGPARNPVDRSSVTHAVKFLRHEPAPPRANTKADSGVLLRGGHVGLKYGVPRLPGSSMKDPRVVKRGGEYHYRKGTGKLLLTKDQIDVGRLLGKHTHQQEKADALKGLQQRGSLPSDDIIRSINTHKPVVVGQGLGTKDVFNPATRSVERYTTRVGGPGVHKPMLESTYNKDILNRKSESWAHLAGLAAHEIGKGIGALHSLGNKSDPTGLKTQGFLGSSPKNAGTQVGRAEEIFKKGLFAGGSKALSYLDRPLATTEAGLGKGLVAAGAIKGDTAKRIKAAPGPGAAFLHGRKSGSVSGGDLVGGLGGPRQLGLLADLGLDPVTWVGVGLAPETGGASTALILERLRKVAPELLRTPEFKAAAQTLNRTGDRKAFGQFVKGLDKPTVIQRLRSATNSAHAKSIVDEAAANASGMAGSQGSHIIESAIRGSDVRAVQPKVELRLQRPISGRVVTIKGKRMAIAQPGSLAKLPVKRMSKAEQARVVETGRRQANTRLDEEKNAIVRQLDEKIKAAQSAKNDPLARKLIAQRQSVEDKYAATKGGLIDQAGQDAIARTVLPGDRSSVTLGEYVKIRNDRKAMHAATLGSTEYARSIGAAFSQAALDAAKVLPKQGRDEAFKRIQMHLWAEEGAVGQGSRQLSHQVPLSPAEQAVADDYRKLYDEMLANGKATGVFGPDSQGIEAYAGPRLWENMYDPAKVVELAKQYAPGAGGFTHGRQIASVFDYADRSTMAAHLREASGGKLSEQDALKLADELHGTSHERAIGELVVRQLQRGENVHWDGMTQLEKRHVDALSRRGLNENQGPLFHTPLSQPHNESEGLVLPAESAWQANGLATDAFHNLAGGERVKAELLSLVKDRQRVRQMLGSASGKTADDLKTIEARLTSRIHEVDPSAAESELSKLAAQTQDLQAGHTERIGLIDQNIADVRAALDELASRISGMPKTVGGEVSPAQVHADTYTALKAAGDTAANHKATAEFIKGLTGEEHTAMRAALDAPTKAAPVAAVNPELRAAHDVAQEVAARGSELLNQRGAAVADHLKALDAVKHQVASVDLTKLESEGHITTKLDANGDLWLRGPQNFDDPPIEGIKLRGTDEAGPNDDPFDYTGRLADLRSTSGAMPNANAQQNMLLRSRSEGMSAGFMARWKGVDQARGRSTTEAEWKYTVKDTGEQGASRDLRVQKDNEGNIIGYQSKADENVIYHPDELTFPPRALMSNAEGDIWLDPATNQEYIRVRHDNHAALNSLPYVNKIPEDRLWPTQAVDALHFELNKLGENDHLFEGALQAGVAKTLSSIRFGVTIPFPAYHIRNLISDMLKSLQADTGVLFHPIVNAKLTKAAFGKGLNDSMNLPGLGKMQTSDLLLLLDHFGGKTGHAQSEIMQLIKETDDPTKFQRGLNKVAKLSGQREDIVRLQTFVQRLRRNGGDAADASWYTIHHHFNYNDLSKSEKRFARNTFLFYTWYRKNIPLQLAELARRPGFFAGVFTTYRDLESGTTPLNVGPMAGPAPGQPAKPDYLRDSLGAVTTAWHGAALNLGFGAPWSDVHILSEKGMGEVFAMMNPLVTTGAQVVVKGLGHRGMDPLTGREYKIREGGPTVDALQAVNHLLGGGDFRKDENGKPVLPWLETYLLRQVPIFGRGTSSLGGVGPTRDGGRLQKYGKLAAPLTGVNVFVSPKPGSGAETLAIKNYIQGEIAGNRRSMLEGLSNIDKNSPAYKNAIKALDAKTKKVLMERGILDDAKLIRNSGYYKRKARAVSGGVGGTGVGAAGGLKP